MGRQTQLVGGGLVRSPGGGEGRGFGTKEPWRKAKIRSKNFGDSEFVQAATPGFFR